MEVNWDQLAKDLKDEALAGMSTMIDGAASDISDFGTAIAQDLVRAARDQRVDLLHELGNQLAALGEVNRIRLVNATWAQVSKVLVIVGRVAMKTLLAAVV